MSSLRLLSSHILKSTRLALFRPMSTTLSRLNTSSESSTTSETLDPPMDLPKEEEITPSEDDQTFASLLRNSDFVKMGDPVGKVVVGYVYHVVNDDLYIDFGCKFPCVCQRPRMGRAQFNRGSKVRLLINDLDLSKLFLGFDKEVTLMEADCTLLGLEDNPDNERSYTFKFDEKDKYKNIRDS